MYRKLLSRAFRLSLISIAISQVFTSTTYAAQSEADRIADLEKKLEQSMQQIQQLSARLNQLEASKTAQPADAPATATATAIAPANANVLQQKIDEQNERIDKIEKNVEQAAESSANQSSSDANLMGVPLHGFISLGYSRLPNTPNQANTLNEKTGFNLANVDFYLAPNFGDRLKSLMELNFEYTDNGVLTYDLERFELGYTLNDQLTVWAGRFHTPFGAWNTAFHHGHYIQLSIDRPRFVAFEDQGGIMPSHTVGLMGSGAVRVNDGDRIQYDAFIGNGSRIIPASDGNTIGIPLGNQLDFNPVGNDKNNVAAGGRISYVFSNGLSVGLHGLSERVNTYDANNVEQNSNQLNFYGGFYFFENDSWQSIGEFYKFHNKDESGGTGYHNSWAAFAQLGYIYNSIWTPYIRYEKANLDQTDNYFASLQSGRSYNRQVLGLRWDFNKSAALKFEFDRTHELEIGAPPDQYNVFTVQWEAKF